MNIDNVNKSERYNAYICIMCVYKSVNIKTYTYMQATVGLIEILQGVV